MFLEKKEKKNPFIFIFFSSEAEQEVQEGTFLSLVPAQLAEQGERCREQVQRPSSHASAVVGGRDGLVEHAKSRVVWALCAP